jgi:DNA polymerase III subunit delta
MPVLKHFTKIHLMAGKPVPALDYLAQPAKFPPAVVCAAFGDETFLRRQVTLGLRAAALGEEGELSLTTFEGCGTLLRDVLDVLSTVAMFGGKRLAIVERADEFVSLYRAELEDYVARPARSGVLVLELESLASNTRLYKAIAAQGLLIDCGTPAPARLCKWLGEWSKQRHGVQLQQTAAETLVEMMGPELGLLDQELAKLALMVGEEKKISVELVGRSVGGWRAKTTWDMLDAALDGKVGEAMIQLDRLLAAGEQPVGLLGQISVSLRRFAAATRLILQAEVAGRRLNLRDALERAGVRTFVLQKAERQLRLLGRRRGVQLYRQILETDLALKGESALPARLILEQLIIALAYRHQPIKS